MTRAAPFAQLKTPPMGVKGTRVTHSLPLSEREYKEVLARRLLADTCCANYMIAESGEAKAVAQQKTFV